MMIAKGIYYLLWVVTLGYFAYHLSVGQFILAAVLVIALVFASYIHTVGQLKEGLTKMSKLAREIIDEATRRVEAAEGQGKPKAP